MALNTESIPDEIEHNARVRVTFSVFDCRGTRFSKNFRLAVDRSERMIQERKKQAHIEPRDRKLRLGVPDYVTVPENRQPRHVNNNDALRWFIETMEGLNKKPF
jgi:hypothetical protein